jgi:hypothetical protein
MVSRSFGQPLTRLDPIKEALRQFVGRAGEKLRRQRLMTSHLMVFVMTNRFSTTRPFYGQSATMRLPYPTDFTPDLIRAAVQLLERLYRPGFHYQKCGVMLMDLSPAAYHRRDFFDTRNQARPAHACPRSAQCRPWRAHGPFREFRRELAGLGDAPAVLQPTLHDALEGIAGGALARVPTCVSVTTSHPPPPMRTVVSSPPPPLAGLSVLAAVVVVFGVWPLRGGDLYRHLL